MDQAARTQIRRLIADEDASARRAVQERLQDIYAEFDAAGALRSDATMIAALAAMEDLAGGFIWDFGSKVKLISKDSEAFALIEGAAGAFLAYLDGRIDEVAVKTAKDDTEDAIRQAAYSARARFSGAKDRLRLRTTMLKVDHPVWEAESPTPATKKNRSGRPVAAHWDEMWAAIALMLQAGDLRPKKQADIERTMSDWLEARDFDGGDTAVRARAGALWNAIEKNRKPLGSDWEEMWETVAAALYAGDLKPLTEADIERAMKDWLAARFRDINETAIRERARTLWRRIQETD